MHVNNHRPSNLFQSQITLRNQRARRPSLSLFPSSSPDEWNTLSESPAIASIPITNLSFCSVIWSRHDSWTECSLAGFARVNDPLIVGLFQMKQHCYYLARPCLLQRLLATRNIKGNVNKRVLPTCKGSFKSSHLYKCTLTLFHHLIFNRLPRPICVAHISLATIKSHLWQVKLTCGDSFSLFTIKYLWRQLNFTCGDTFYNEISLVTIKFNLWQ